MKKTLKILLPILIICIVGSAYYNLTKPTKINSFIASKIYKNPANTAFTDENFYKCVVDTYNNENNTSIAYTTNLTDEQLATIISLKCSGSDKSDVDKIKNVQGIEKLINLDYIHFFDNLITEIDLSNNIKLEHLDLRLNSLQNIDLSHNINLKFLALNSNLLLTELDVSNNTKLEYLSASSTDISSIDLSNNLLLDYIDLGNTYLSEIDVSKQTELIFLSLHRTNVGDIDLSKNLKLQSLYAYNSSLNEIDLSNNTELTQLNLSNCKLGEIDLSKNLNLTNLSINNNELTEIDLSNNKNIDTLYIIDNELLELDVSKNVKLRTLYANSNNLTQINLENNLLISSLHLNNNEINSIDLTKNTNLTSLELENNLLTQIDLSMLENLTGINFKKNKLTEIDLSKNLSLETINLEENLLKTINLESHNKLKQLLINNNPFEFEIAGYVGTHIVLSQDIGLIKIPDNSNTHLDGNSLSIQNEADGISIYNKKILILNDAGEYKVDAIYYHNIPSGVTYSGTYNVKVIELTSDIYKIVEAENYIYTGTETDEETILNNISLNYGEASIEDNKLLIKYNDKTLKTFDVVNVSSDQYDIDLSKFKLYIGQNKFSLDDFKFNNCEGSFENNYLTIKKGTYTFKSLQVVSINSDYYTFKNRFVFLPQNVIDDKKIEINSGYYEIKDNKLLIKSGMTVLEEFEILSLIIKNMNTNFNYISISNDISYDDFINNITVSEGLTYKIFNGESEITEGNISEGMNLQVYYNDEVIFTYKITDEYLDLSLLNVDDDKKLIKDLVIGTKISEFKDKISTTGNITVVDKDNEILTDDKLIASGSNVKIELTNETYEYTLSVRGDVTGNGQAKMADVMKIATHIIEGNVIEGEAFERAADITGDGKIKMNDVMKLATFIIDGGEL